MWDAKSGTRLFDLKGHTRPVTSVAFSLDGIAHRHSQCSSCQGMALVSGQELVGAPIPPTPRPGEISPDGRWIAHIFGNRVELITLQPDEHERSYRRLVMQPNCERYRAGFLAAKKVNDRFAARFYLNLLPPPERHQPRRLSRPCSPAFSTATTYSPPCRPNRRRILKCRRPA